MGNAQNIDPTKVANQVSDQKPGQPQQQKNAGLGKPSNGGTVGGNPSDDDNAGNTSGSVKGSGKANK